MSLVTHRSLLPTRRLFCRPPLQGRSSRSRIRSCVCHALHRGDIFPQPQPPTVQEVITFVTAEGIVQIPGRRIQVSQDAAPQHRPGRHHDPLPTWEEQGLCIGSTFAVAATNGIDPARRVNFLGFCQSVDILTDAVEDTVLSRGGEILEQERQLKSGIQPRVVLTVCIPFLWGVPPELEALSAAIVSGGGIVDKVYKQWGMYRLPIHRSANQWSSTTLYQQGSSDLFP
eukprot:jgi/Chrzof1/5270/Cz15g20060.t1